MTYNYNDSNFKNSELYKKFISENPSIGYIKIRAYQAGEAIPIEGLKIIISKEIEKDKIIFYEGQTNQSGIIEKIELPAPILNSDLNTPNRTKYNIQATYNEFQNNYIVNIFENIIVIQNINVPSNNIGEL